ncbi:MAG: hypothetical protein ACUVV0_02970 [Anaerolineae bacterium]
MTQTSISEVALTVEQIITAIRRLNEEDKEKVRQELAMEEWRQEIRGLLARIRARLVQNTVTEREIEEEVRFVREMRRAERLAQGGN